MYSSFSIFTLILFFVVNVTKIEYVSSSLSLFVTTISNLFSPSSNFFVPVPFTFEFLLSGVALIVILLISSTFNV